MLSFITKKETTLHGRLFFFFSFASVLLILSFALLLMLFGITGREEKTALNQMNTELSILSDAIEEDFGQLALEGIAIAEELATICDNFFQENALSASMLAEHPELIEPLLSAQIQTLIHTIKSQYCGGVFTLLDATITADSDINNTRKAGIFLKKTQPTSTGNLGVNIHYLRGPAQIAREHEIMLLGQWHMEYDISEQTFFTAVMENARSYPDLPLSRLYYWSGRVTLKDNSESGFLLCVPLRSADGTVFGVCGIEVSDRLFKSLYSPSSGDYENIFTVMSPLTNDCIQTSLGLIAGNHYLTGTRWSSDLIPQKSSNAFEVFSSGTDTYSGKTTSLCLYPSGSPYEEETWTVGVLMPQNLLTKASRGNENYFFYTVIGLVILSLLISVFISRHYLKPVTEALHSIRHIPHDERKSAPYLEINDLLEFLASKDRETEEKLRQTEQSHQHMQSEYEKAQLELSRLAYSRKQEVDPDLYQQFLNHLYTLTPTEREVFDLYLAGKSVKEILEILNIKENTLKYHNKNIYSKLGVTSRKELLRYAALMNQEKKQNT